MQPTSATAPKDQRVSNRPRSSEASDFTREVESGDLGTASREEIRSSVNGSEDVGQTPAPDYSRLSIDTSDPEDIAVATYGPPPPQQEVVIGEDERTRIQNTAAYPWRMNASLQIIAQDNKVYLGTGWFISPDTLITAGHCLYVHDPLGRSTGWVREIRVMPGRDHDSLPFTPVVSDNFHSVVGWTRDQDPHFDYGVIVIPSTLGAATGSYSFGVFEDDWLVGKQANIAGYPADKRGDEDGTLWHDVKPILAVDTHQIHYEVDTYGGQSGSAVWVIDGDKRYAVGIHAYGDRNMGNSATRINPSMMTNLKAWRSKTF